MEFGQNSWPKVAFRIPGRSARQCRDRWRHYFQAPLDEQPWSLQEDLIFRKAVAICGTRWSVIQPLLTGRSESELRRHWLFQNCKRDAAKVAEPMGLDEFGRREDQETLEIAELNLGMEEHCLTGIGQFELKFY
jgi:hypothetical protein